MGGYDLIDNTLHYTGDGWVSCELTDEQVVDFNEGKLDLYGLVFK